MCGTYYTNSGLCWFDFCHFLAKRYCLIAYEQQIQNLNLVAFDFLKPFFFQLIFLSISNLAYASRSLSCFVVSFLKRTGIVWFKSDLIRSNWFKLDQIRSSWIQLDQIGSNQIKSDQVGSDCLFGSNQVKLVQTGSNWIKSDQVGSNDEKRKIVLDQN